MSDIQWPTRLDVELWALGELDAPRVAVLEALRESDEEVRAWADGIRASVVDAETDLPMLQLPVEGAAEPWYASLGWGWIFRPGGLAALGAAALVAIAVTLFMRPPEPTEVFRGSIDIELHLVRDGVAQQQGALVRARAGDRLQFLITTPADGSLSIFDLQDDGELTEWMAPREVRGLQPVDFAVMLDDYAGSERVYIIFSDDPVGRSDVERALQSTYDRPLADLDAVPGLLAGSDGRVIQRSILVYKEAGP
jgi:hypothetical protein